VVFWNAILGACAVHGHGKEALHISEQTCEEGIQPNDSSLLSICRQAGLVDEGMRCYASMITDYMISTNLKHYSCVVGPRAVLTHVASRMALLGACRVHGNVEMGEHFAKRVLQLEPENAAGYVLLSNTYDAASNGHLCEEC
jgi:pentatricopeptide repeat protein